MPRYYFHLRSKDELVWDEEGADFPDPAIARRAADRIAGKLRSGLLYRVDDDTPWTIAVADEGGEIIRLVSL